MRRIRANAIAILTVAWILGTFYYLWQDNKPPSTPAAAWQSRGRGHGQKVGAAPGRLEIHPNDGTLPLIVSAPGDGRGWTGGGGKGAAGECVMHVDVRARKLGCNELLSRREVV